MTEHTTIQITKTQAQQLKELRQYDDEPYKSVIARLLGDSSDIANQETADEIKELKDQLSMVNEPGVEFDVDELYERLDTVEGRLKDLQTDVKTLQERLER
jgi:chromosome segregation ATPase